MGFIPTSRSHTARPSRVDPQNNFVKVHVCANGDITVKQGYTKDDNLIIDRLDALILTYTIQFNTTGKLDNFSSTFLQVTTAAIHLINLDKLNAAHIPDKTIRNLFIDNNVWLLSPYLFYFSVGPQQ